MVAKSSSKGKRLEKDVVDAFNNVFECKEFKRTPSSGAIMGQSNFHRNRGLDDDVKQTLGSDLICPKWFKFSVECKNYNDSPSYNNIISGSDTALNGWIGETLFDSINLQLTPLLVFRTSRKGTFVAVPDVICDLNSLDSYAVYHNYTIIEFEKFISQIKAINDSNNSRFESVQQWVRTDNNNINFLSMLLTQLTKTKKVAKAEATQYLLEELLKVE